MVFYPKQRANATVFGRPPTTPAREQSLDFLF